MRAIQFSKSETVHLILHHYQYVFHQVLLKHDHWQVDGNCLRYLDIDVIEEYGENVQALMILTSLPDAGNRAFVKKLIDGSNSDLQCLQLRCLCHLLDCEPAAEKLLDQVSEEELIEKFHSCINDNKSDVRFFFLYLKYLSLLRVFWPRTYSTRC